jgi:hypothetical protein
MWHPIEITIFAGDRTGVFFRTAPGTQVFRLDLKQRHLLQDPIDYLVDVTGFATPRTSF